MKRLLFFLIWLPMAASAQQEVPVDRKAYPDYVDPQVAWKPEPRLMKFKKMAETASARKETKDAKRISAQQEAMGLPDHWNNADTKYFPPVFNQVGGSCGSASRIGYMFTHEINALRDVDGSLMENRYPTHFVWNHTYNNDGKDEFVEYIGVPNAVVFGGYTYSSIYGNYDWKDDNFGWMQGYDRWFNAMCNRMTKPTSNPLTVQTEEGRLAAKAWLYNHAGDKDFKAGGLIGLGVASGGNWGNIGTTEANKAAGVVGKYYVKAWGQSVDHAVTMVGWDDRIEFDLDGNGVYGEKNKDEVGAWIIVNSWGGWCNDGFIYCPYANAGPIGANGQGGYWSGELYHARKNYRPLRTIKLKMQYSHRSEIKLTAGVSANLKAKAPESTTDMHFFRYAGDSNNGNTNPAPEVPMLGKWADGIMHTEAMEFGYDLTDLTASFDRNQPLKYFFTVNTRSWAQGEGRILAASMIDYEHDPEGVETPFDLGDGAEVEIQNAGKTTVISVIVNGAGYFKVNSLAINDGMLSWMKPDMSSHTVDHYNVYYDSYKIAETKDLQYKYDETTGDAVYSVTAVYEDGTESAKMSVATPVQHQETNQVCEFNGSGFTIPDVFKSHYDNCTIEYWIKPTEFTDWNCIVGPGWGTWYQHFNANGKYTVGWDTSNRVNSSATFAAGKWTLISIVVEGSKLTLYKDGQDVGSVSSGSHRGLGSFGDLVFSANENKNAWQKASYDEIRIWNVARTAAEIRGGSLLKKYEFVGSMMPAGLIAYYKGDTFMAEDGNTYMRDCVGGHHARIMNDNARQVDAQDLVLGITTKSGTVTLQSPGTVYAQVPVQLCATTSYTINSIKWTIDALSIKQVPTMAPTVTFPEAGTYTVQVDATDYAGNQITKTMDVTVLEDTAAIDATFKPTATTVKAGDRVSFNPNTTKVGCSYVWHFEGAEVEEVKSVSAAAKYAEAGVHKATLTVTSADGRSASSSVDITVKKVAPKADFELDKTILNLGETVAMTSHTKYDPTGYEWIIANGSGTTVVKYADPTYTFTPTTSGRYNVTLKASNEIGQNACMKENAFIVANDDSENGLNFGSDYRTARAEFKQQPIPASGSTGVAYTIDFWAKINKLEAECLGIGNKDNFQLWVDEAGAMHLTVDGKDATSAKEFVIAGEWHNYSVVHGKDGSLTFYRDGQRFGSIIYSTPVYMPSCKRFSIGTLVEEGNEKGGVAFIGSIDELRIWNNALSKDDLQAVINRHLDADEMAELMSTKKLVAYYDFNQNGDAIIPDRTTNGNDLTRYYFGPEGDAWGLSKGVFTLDLNEQKVTNVTSSLMNNYQRPFAHLTQMVNNTTVARFYAIKNWTLENTTQANGTTAGVHVDLQKSSDFTCTTGWDSFGSLTNHKAYQTLTLEPGMYTLSVTFGQHGAAGESYLVAAAGTGLPDADQLGTSLGYNDLESQAVQFLVDQTMEVSLGILVANMNGKSIFTIQKFKLTKSPVDIITGIGDEVYDAESAQGATSQRGIYDLQGRKLQQAAKPGLYIINGKKVLVN